jgi:hypothetical protein
MKTKTSFSVQEMKAFEPAEKIGLVACVNPDGLPHISLITSIMAPQTRPAYFGPVLQRVEQTIYSAKPSDFFFNNDHG